MCLGAVAAGTVLGWTANIQDKLKNQQDLNDILIDEDTFGWIGSLTTIGAMLMCFSTGTLCDLIGRKWGCLVQTIPFTLGWILIIFSANVGMILAGRFLTGLAAGAFCVAAPLYSSEIAEKNIRGTLGSFFQLLLVVGILIAYLGGAFLSSKNLSILCLAIPLLFAILFFLQPETPIYLMKKKKNTEALASLKRLRGSAYNCENELEEIKEILQNNSESKVSLMEILSTTAAKKSLLICFSLMFFQQMSGVNAIIFYTSSIFGYAKSGLTESTATIIVGVMQVIATLVSSLVVDKFGRRILLLSSVVFMMLSGFILAIYFSLKNAGKDVTGISFLPILCVIVFISTFSLGFGPIPWMISAEILPPEIKSVASSVAGTFNWLLAFIITKFYSTAVSAIGIDTTFYIFSGICLMGCCFVFFIVPETKGKSILEVQEILNGETKSHQNKEGIDNPNFKN